MKAGIIGVPTSGEIGRIESQDDVKEQYGMEFHTTLDVQRVQDLDGETKFVEGTALKEEQEEHDQAQVEDGSIRVREARRKAQSWADFIAVEARNDHPGFVVVSTSDAEFVFDVVARLSTPGTMVERAEVALGDFVNDRDQFTVEGGGASETGSPNASTLMTWGDEIDQDDQVGRYIQKAMDTNLVPIVNGRYVFDGWTIHCNVAASGWVEVWSPDWDTAEYLDWVERQIMPYVVTGDDD